MCYRHAINIIKQLFSRRLTFPLIHIINLLKVSSCQGSTESTASSCSLVSWHADAGGTTRIS